MARKKIEITPTQIECIKEAADLLSGMVGVGTDFDPVAKRIVKNIDRMLKQNGLKGRDYK
jgi:hypothetical protein